MWPSGPDAESANTCSETPGTIEGTLHKRRLIKIRASEPDRESNQFQSLVSVIVASRHKVSTSHSK